VIRGFQATSIATLVAQYNAIVTLADGERWKSVLRDAGLDDFEIAQAENSDCYHSLLAQLREAETRGLNVRDDLSTLISIRSLDDVGDVAAILTHRVARYVSAMGYPELTRTQLVAGLFPRATEITDPDVVSALRARDDAIEEHARYLALEAIGRGDGWLRHFGEVPEADEHFEPWLREVVAGMAYLELWGSENFGAVSKVGVSHQQEMQHGRVLRAMERVRTPDRDGDSRAFSSIGPSSGESFESHIPYFVVDR
jgi:hypothetical protein